MPRLHALFSRAWRRLHVFASNSDWFITLFASVVIGQSNYSGFGFTTLNWKPLYIRGDAMMAQEDNKMAIEVFVQMER